MSNKNKKQPRPRNVHAQKLAEEGRGSTRAFQDRKAEEDKQMCRGKIDPEEFLEGIENEFEDLEDEFESLD